ncbi:MAG: magnesium-dependent phosphatase-1 [Candidatus Marsarchaeota archaeon]
MRYKLVVLDLDGTIWDYPKTSSVLPEPITVQGDAVVAADGTRLLLRDGLRDFLKACAERGVLVSLASWNSPNLPVKMLSALGLMGYFAHPKLEPHPYKELMLKEILEDFNGEGVRISPEEVVFVDDRDVMVQRVKERFPSMTCLQFGVDVRSYSELEKIACGRG